MYHTKDWCMDISHMGNMNGNITNIVPWLHRLYQLVYLCVYVCWQWFERGRTKPHWQISHIHIICYWIACRWLCMRPPLPAFSICCQWVGCILSTPDNNMYSKRADKRACACARARAPITATQKSSSNIKLNDQRRTPFKPNMLCANIDFHMNFEFAHIFTQLKAMNFDHQWCDTQSQCMHMWFVPTYSRAFSLCLSPHLSLFVSFPPFRWPLKAVFHKFALLSLGLPKPHQKKKQAICNATNYIISVDDVPEWEPNICLDAPAQRQNNAMQLNALAIYTHSKWLESSLRIYVRLLPAPRTRLIEFYMSD